MIYYKAVCRAHRWQSSLFITSAAAARSARAHRASSGGTHSMEILEVFIDASALQVRSKRKLS